MIPLGGRNVRLFSDFWRVVREFNPEDIVREAKQPFDIVISGGKSVDKNTLAQGVLAGAPLAIRPSLVRQADLPGDPSLVETPDADVVIHVVDAATGFTAADRKLAVGLFGATRPVVFVFQSRREGAAAEHAIASLASARRAVVDLFGSHATEHVVYLDPSTNGLGPRSVLHAILTVAPQKRLAIGRRLPTARSWVADDVIFQTSLANAQFALLSSLPANIPILGGIIGSGTDFVVLTKNQALMVFRLAALYDKDHSPKIRMMAEIAPVVGAAFLWRTLARTLVGVLPTLVSALPKTAIAFAGTYLVGRAAQHYYATGQKPGEADLAKYSLEATEAWGGVFRPEVRQESSQSQPS